MTKYDRLSHEVLLQALHYDPVSGHFTWKFRPGVTRAEKTFNAVLAGKRAGNRNKDGYRVIGMLGAAYQEHRLAFFYMTKEWPLLGVDHRDLAKDNNAWGNLREADATQNQGNAPTRRDNRLGFKGVSAGPNGRYIAKLRARGVRHYLGTFGTPEEAHQAYAAAATKHFGAFARSI